MRNHSKFSRIGLSAFFFVVAMEYSIAVAAQGSASPERRDVTVADAIEMTRLGDPSYFQGAAFAGQVAQFSADGKYFVVVVRQGVLNKDSNDYRLYVYHTADVLKSPRPALIKKMASTSNRPAIQKVRWMPDNHTLVFLGENPHEVSQVYMLNIRNGQIKSLTHSSTAINSYDISRSGQTLVYTSDPPEREHHESNTEKHYGITIDGQRLEDAIAGKESIASKDSQLFVQHIGIPAREIRIDEPIHPFSRVSIAPDGEHAIVSSMFRKMNPIWADYQVPGLREKVVTSRPSGLPTGLQHLNLIDTVTGSVRGLLNVPMLNPNLAMWSSDSRTLYLRSLLPLDVSDRAERDIRQQGPLPAALKIKDGTLRRLSEDEWRHETEESSSNAHTPIAVTMEEDVNHPPKLFASVPILGRRSLLLDLNPQFKSLKFGKVQRFEWRVNGAIDVQGGLYLPPDYVAGRRYPLVIQLHGFDENRFTMDGLAEWSSGYAARPLAAAGFIVLQAFSYMHRGDHDAIDSGKDKRFGINPNQSGRNLNVQMIESAIETLDKQGIIDPHRVGISGFSRTVSAVGYLLTHSKRRIAAAVLTDGIDGGYYQYISFPGDAYDANAMNGGKTPFGSGIQDWIEESPSVVRRK